MYRVTTPTHTFTMPIEASACSIIKVIYSQVEGKTVWKYKDNTLPTGMTLSGKDVMIRFTQEQTKSLVSKYPIMAQVRVLTNDGDVFDSQIFSVGVEEPLDDEVLTND